MVRLQVAVMIATHACVTSGRRHKQISCINHAVTFVIRGWISLRNDYSAHVRLSLAFRRQKPPRRSTKSTGKRQPVLVRWLLDGFGTQIKDKKPNLIKCTTRASCMHLVVQSLEPNAGASDKRLRNSCAHELHNSVSVVARNERSNCTLPFVRCIFGAKKRTRRTRLNSSRTVHVSDKREHANRTVRERPAFLLIADRTFWRQTRRGRSEAHVCDSRTRVCKWNTQPACVLCPFEQF